MTARGRLLTVEEVLAICALYGQPPAQSVALFHLYVEDGLPELDRYCWAMRSD
jgi:hypothetical protein